MTVGCKANFSITQTVEYLGILAERQRRKAMGLKAVNAYDCQVANSILIH
ncbi:hypothetical protein SPSIL_039780 [Sporomusa silvacetica DSM 10669]|uniref:Uncharacterized protein n=1 Tax=Sporomusa silvacetica DSM 10669 TaxID=1123289 RepID=A0ABZ3IQ43_9FIRM|nr:hypothetical protein SPSIL_38460 [Sporomusa silvacetica DSM 10669]